MLEDRVPAEHKQKYDMAKGVFQTQDKRAAVEGFVPEGYKGTFQKTTAIFDKAAELKK